MTGHAYLVVANRHAARMFEILDGASQIQETECLVNPYGRTSSRDMVTDRPGHMSSASGAHFTRGDGMAGKALMAHNLEVFAQRVAKSLDDKRKKDKTYYINIIAEPQFLGALRKCLTKQTEKLVWRTLNKDVIAATPDVLLTYLKGKHFH